MRYNRRQFIGMVGLAGAGAYARVAFAGDRFNFVGINDLHVKAKSSTPIIDRAVAQINAGPRVAFTAALGDLATDGTSEELRLVEASLSALRAPCFAVPGNHDVTPRAKKIYEQYELRFGSKEWKRESLGWAFIGLDTCNGTKSHVTVPDERMAWLKAQLKKIAPKRPIAMFAHHPFNPNTKNYRVKNADAILALFKGHNLKLVATGHYHGNQVETRDGVLFTTSACCSTTRPNFDRTRAKGYRLYQVNGDKITSKFVEVSAK